MKFDGFRLRVSEFGDLRRMRMVILLGPLLPCDAVSVGKGTPGGKVLQLLALRLDEFRELRDVPDLAPA